MMAMMAETSERTTASELPQGLCFESYGIDHLVDADGHHRLPLDPEFPFNIVPFSYETLKPEVRLTWHNRLELFFPVKGYGSFRMGERIIDFKGGDHAAH